MIPESHIPVLESIYKKINSSPVPILWVLTGSLSFALRGIPLEVHDIDIQSDRDGTYRIEALFAPFSEKKVRFVDSPNIRSHLGLLCINGVEVEIMGDIQKKLSNGCWEDPVNLVKHRRYLNFRGMSIPVLSLEYEYQAYLKMGRIEKAGLLKKWMEKGGKE